MNRFRSKPHLSLLIAARFFAKLRIIFAISLFTLLTSCNETFQPLMDNDSVSFSIYGYLDATADTQWVRVAPVRKLLASPVEKPEMMVSLEHLSSGDKVVMSDTLLKFQFPTGINAVNTFTDMKLEPGQSYLLTAEKPDGNYSKARVTLPENFPVPKLQITGHTNDLLYISGVDHLIDIQVRFFYRIIWAGQVENLMIAVPVTNRAQRTGDGEYLVRINNHFVRTGVQLLLPANANAEILHRQIFVAQGGPEWDENIRDLNDLVYILPDVYSNIENGIGYLIGIVSKSIPYKSCYAAEEPDKLIACPEEQQFFY